MKNLIRVAIWMVFVASAIHAAGTETHIGERGQFYVDGEPTIPLSVWHAPIRQHGYNRHLGLDCLMAPRTDPREYLASAQEHGMGAFIGSRADLSEYPALWGYNVPQSRPYVQWLRSRMRDRDERRVVVMNFRAHDILAGEDTDHYREMIALADVIVSHVWPEIFHEEGRDVRYPVMLVQRLRELSEEAGREGEVSIWPSINPHEWKMYTEEERPRRSTETESFEAPTTAEFRFQIWGSLINGADGICIFPISFEPFVFSQIPARKEEFLMRETQLIRRLAPVLSDSYSPVEVEVEGLDGIVDYTTRRHEGRDYVFFINGIDERQRVRLRAEGLGTERNLRDVVTDHRIETDQDVYEEELDGWELRIWELEPLDQQEDE